MKLGFTPEQWQTFREEDSDGCYDCRNDGLNAVFASMSPEQLREFASGLITEANEREGYTVDR